MAQRTHAAKIQIQKIIYIIDGHHSHVAIADRRTPAPSCPTSGRPRAGRTAETPPASCTRRHRTTTRRLPWRRYQRRRSTGGGAQSHDSTASHHITSNRIKQHHITSHHFTRSTPTQIASRERTSGAANMGVPPRRCAGTRAAMPKSASLSVPAEWAIESSNPRPLRATHT